MPCMSHFVLMNFQECERITKSRKKSSAEVMGSDDGKLNRRSTRFGRWKAGSLSDGFRQWKAESQEYQVRTMESRIAKRWVQTMESCIAEGQSSDNGKQGSREKRRDNGKLNRGGKGCR